VPTYVVVGKGKIYTATVNIHLIAKYVRGHHRALFHVERLVDAFDSI
jgi:hypothetical protein